MVGVSDPELKRDRSAGWRLLGGLAAGYLVATLIGSVALYGVAFLLRDLVAADLRRVLLLALIAAFGVADLLGRTPNANRQVPQRFVRDLAPLPRGLMWGMDLGLLVTTQKSSSLLWVAALGAVLVAPLPAVPAVLLTAGAVYLIGVSVLSVVGAGRITDLDFGAGLIPALQRASGAVLTALALTALALGSLAAGLLV